LKKAIERLKGEEEGGEFLWEEAIGTTRGASQKGFSKRAPYTRLATKRKKDKERSKKGSKVGK